MSKSVSQAVKFFQSHGGILRTKEAIDLGIHPSTLYQMKDEGTIDQLRRGLYALKDLPGHAHPDLVQIAKMVPEAVICLISALSFHGLTTQIPHYVYVAVRQSTRVPKITYPPARFFWFSEKTYSTGIEIHYFSGVKIRCYNLEKTIVDCFKHRNKIGIDVALEALRNYLSRVNINLQKLKKYAVISRVDKVMTPYIEALLE